MYLNAHSTISFQDTFRKKGYSASISPETINTEPYHPDYDQFVHIMMRRRMSDAMKMSAACAKDCVEQMKGIQPDGIILGTSTGSSAHTKNFIETINAAGDKAISPTSFITSTHNTIAGQLSLLLENRGYNITHTQNSLSFEHALFDAHVCLKEGMEHILVGSAEEKENTLFSLRSKIGTKELNVSHGASFFIVSREPGENNACEIIDLLCHSLVSDPLLALSNFLAKNRRDPETIDLVLYTGDHNRKAWLETFIADRNSINYGKLCGDFMTNSGFALDMAADILSSDENIKGKKTDTILIINYLDENNLGLILLGKTNQ